MKKDKVQFQYHIFPLLRPCNSTCYVNKICIYIINNITRGQYKFKYSVL